MLFRKNNSNIRDGRKYRMSIICLLLILVGYIAGSINPVFSAGYEEFITGILGVLFTYCTGNVARSAFRGKNVSINQGTESNEAHQS